MRCLALFSGGLDSLLAIKLMREQGIDVIALHFNTGFGGVKNKTKILEDRLKQVDAILKIVDIRDDFIKDILFSPKYGYGKNFNPCIDCHAKMILVAKSLLSELDASFIISGEVVGQRPMSQNRRALNTVSNLSDEGGLLLRPMSAKILPETIPEKEGWVDREKLLDVCGKGRYRQLELVEQYGIRDYESPAGGCLLTDSNFSHKLKEFIDFDKKFTVDDIDILKYGRQFRLPDGAKLIIGRDEKDNEMIDKISNSKFIKAIAPDLVGPTSLISKDASLNDKHIATKLILTYSRCDRETHSVRIGDELFSDVKLDSKEIAKEYMIQI
jgi:tRNA-specific 2-thiouridylase